ESDYNLVVQNSIWFNTNEGIKIHGASQNNQIYHCDLVDNGQNACDYSDNLWDNGYPDGGNYWSDYTGEDLYSGPLQNIPGSDSIGDVPYQIPSSSKSDNYPLMYLYGIQPPEFPQTVYVDDDFTPFVPGYGYDHFKQIEPALSAVETGGTVIVSNGLYYENLTVERRLTLSGESPLSTIIDGNWNGSVITITHDSVIFNGFKIAHSGNSSQDAGIKVISDKNQIFNNYIVGNGATGLYFINSCFNNVYENVISTNSFYGIFLENQSDSSLIYHNDIAGNLQNALDSCSNIWNDIYPAGGNYWGDYYGIDEYSGPEQSIPGSDGIGDTPYSVPGSGNTDAYPLMQPYNFYTSTPDTVYVDDNYNNGTPGWGFDHFAYIQFGIDAVSAGGLVIVRHGTYIENLLINKAITVNGENKDSVFVEGDGSGHIFKINANFTGIKDMTIKYSGVDYSGIYLDNVTGTGISNNIVCSNGHGIYLNNSDSNDITNNSVIDNYYHGIKLNYSNSINNLIRNNIITDNGYDGIALEGAYYNNIIGNEIILNSRAISLSWYCEHNNIENNIIKSNGGEAFGANYAEHNTFVGNFISNHTRAFNFHACSNNLIAENTIQGSMHYGIYLPDCMCGGCVNNIIYHNNWQNNGYHVYCECVNTWHNGYPDGGNFYDDYSGVDLFSGPNQNIPGPDGIGDTPYNFYPGYNDQYPLMDPFGMAPLPDTVYVDDDYNSYTPGWGYDHFKSITNGINAVKNRGTVLVANGTYAGKVHINKRIELLGENSEFTIINGINKYDGIIIYADSVLIESFAIENCGNNSTAIHFNKIQFCNVQSCFISNSYNGIVLDEANNNNISGCTIKNNTNGGIWVSDSESNQIMYNDIVNNRLGIGIDGSKYNSINNNNISGNDFWGGVYQTFSSNNVFSNNNISDNTPNGIYIASYSSYNHIEGNTICNNSEYGIEINSYQNTIYHNTISGNQYGNARDSGGNTWHNGYGSPFNPTQEGGNYWADYSGQDIFSGPGQNIPGPDGIGDTPYIISGGNNEDKYPFISPGGWNLLFNLTVFVEGPFSGTEMNTLLNSQGLLPLSQPFNVSPWNYYGQESVVAIPNTDIVDWLLIELRDATSAAAATSQTIIARRAAFVLKDGSIVESDGQSLLNYNSLSITNELYVVVYHLNSLGIISANSLTQVGGVFQYNFTTGEGQVFGGLNGHKEIAPGIWGMVGADGNSDKQINNADKIDVWSIQSGSAGYFNGDYNMDGNVNKADKIDIWMPNTGMGGQVPDSNTGYKSYIPQ
ncbi:MAG: right-handed parallel beta-helix repeat-containing protein, partial [Bacteroidales bacterium]|nr:right-handed parallel beta-helix repeat-containing protein [Bacteroidales bacterium]